MHADRISTDCSELPLVALCAHGCLLVVCAWHLHLGFLVSQGFFGSSVMMSSSTGGIVFDTVPCSTVLVTVPQM